jgi:hypothetical protein
MTKAREDIAYPERRKINEEWLISLNEKLPVLKMSLTQIALSSRMTCLDKGMM